MRLFAEEKRSGTIDLLYTSPITDLELYNFISQAIYDVHLRDRTNAGYIAGFISAMHEKKPQEQRVTAALGTRTSGG